MPAARVVPLVTCLALATVAGAVTAEAQPAGSTPAEGGHDERREDRDAAEDDETPPSFSHEIVVSARRVEESQQEVPLSVSAYQRDDVDALQLFAPDDLRNLAPSLQFYEFNIGLPHYFVRGIGSVNRSAASDPAVGLFLDDVYIGRGSGPTGDYVDVERIEVLRGPQGTLFGRNTVGGAVVIHTRRPSSELEGSLSIRGGNHERLDLAGIFNLPLSRRAFARVVVLGKSYQGHAFSTLTRRHLEDEHRRAVRASFRLLPSRSLDVNLSLDLTRDQGEGNWWHLGAEGPLSIGNANPDPRRGPNPVEGLEERDDRGGSFSATWTTSRFVTTVVTSYREHHYRALDNTTGLFVAELDDPDRFRFHHTLFVQGQRQMSKTLSQEVRWSSSVGHRLTMVGGLYYFQEDVERLPTTRYRFVFFDSEGEFGHDARNLLTSRAAFGQAEYTFDSGLAVALGLRYSQDRKRHRSSTLGRHFLGFRDQGVPVDGWSVRASGRWSEVTPLVSVRFPATPNATLYATVAKGFKSGGFNDEAAERATVATPFGPEIAWNYEIGLKSYLWHRRCRVNVSAFHLDYDDLQVEQFIQPDPSLPPIEIITNAGSSYVRGVELDWDARFGSGAWIYGSYSFLGSEVEDLLFDGVEVSGNRLAYAPKNMASVGVGHRLDLGRRGTLLLRAGYSYTSRSFGDIGNSPVIELEPRKLLDVGGEWIPVRGSWSLGFWGKNLTDQTYPLTATEVPVADRYEKLGAPRQYGLEARYRFKLPRPN